MRPGGQGIGLEVSVLTSKSLEHVAVTEPRAARGLGLLWPGGQGAWAWGFLCVKTDCRVASPLSLLAEVACLRKGRLSLLHS